MENKNRKKDLFNNAMSNLMNDKLGVSIDLLDELIKAESKDRLAWLARGSVYLKMGNSQNAISDFNQAIELDSNHPKAYHLRGLAREMAGEYDEALVDFGKAIDIEPEYGAAYYSRATLFTKMGREDEAARDMQMVTHLTNLNIENFANENNIWRSRQMQLEEML
ncbi:MAG: tetratricopeptide repeat protein [Desulfobacteraceae bacterium]|jgi:tetratricopeptide (TPR) repeat protein|nr:tetratricopeptide repeat protein [Desulfobacteraceae bacterium]